MKVKPKDFKQYFVYGMHTVTAVLKYQPFRAKKLFVARKKDAQDLIFLAKQNGVDCEELERHVLEHRFSVESDAQGIVLVCSSFDYLGLEDVLVTNPNKLLLLDSWQDSVNVGRAARAALAFGIDAIVMCKDRSVAINAHAEKAAVGALSQVKVVRVTNLASAIEKIKAQNMFVYGAAENGEVLLNKCDFANKVAIVVGQEGDGLRTLTKKSCDVLVRIPAQNICLNAADSALLFLYQLSIR